MNSERNGPTKLDAIPSRRDFLRASALGLSAIAIPGCSGRPTRDASQPVDRGLIDAHVHVWTPDTQRYPLAKGYEIASMRPSSFEPEELFAHSRPAGITRIVLIQMSFYRDDNSYMLDVIRDHPGVFSGVGIIDEDDAPVTRMKELAERGVRGFRIQPRGRSPDEWLTGAGMRAMWAEAASSRQHMCPLIMPNYLGSLDAMCERYPETGVIVDHFGRVGIDGNVRAESLDELCRLARHANVKVKVSAYYALGAKKPPYLDLAPMFRRVFDAFGPDRLMWASDCPFQVRGEHTYEASVALVRDHLEFLDPSDRDWILRKTAERAFFGSTES